MRPKHFAAAAQRGHFNGAQEVRFVGSYASAHTGTGHLDMAVGLGPQGIDRQNVVALHYTQTGGNLSDVPVVTLGGKFPYDVYDNRGGAWWQETSRGCLIMVFPTHDVPGDEATLHIEPVASQAGIVAGVWNALGYHTGFFDNFGGHTGSADISSVVAGDVIFAGVTLIVADSNTWTAGISDERYDIGSGSTVTGSGGDNFNPTPATPYTISQSSGTPNPMRFGTLRPKRGLQDRLIYLLRMTGAHGSADVADASWRNTTPNIETGTARNEYTGRYFSAGSGAFDFDKATNVRLGRTRLPSHRKHTGWCAEWWEYPHTLNAGTRIGNSANTRLIVGHTSPALSLYISGNGSQWNIANGRSLGTDAANTWTHRALSWTGDHWYTFENGIMVDNWASSLNPYHAINESMRVGRGQGGYYDGLMEDFAVWNYAKYTKNFALPTEPIKP